MGIKQIIGMFNIDYKERKRFGEINRGQLFIEADLTVIIIFIKMDENHCRAIDDCRIKKSMWATKEIFLVNLIMNY